MKNILLLILLIVFSGKLFANSNNYKPGYIILESGDTLTGFIKNKSWRKNPTKVIFTSPSIKNDTLTYSIQKIKGFSSNDFIFIKKSVQIDQQGTSLNSVNDFSGPKFREDTVLLELLIMGEANFYSYREENGRTHYYIESNASVLQELLNTVFTKVKFSETGSKKSYVGYAEEYKNQLLTSLIGCKSITYNEVDIEFKESKLSKLILTYNECMSPNDAIYSKKVEKWQIRPYIIAGLNVSSLKIKTDNAGWAYLDNADFSNSVTFTANIGLRYVIPKYQGKLQIYTDFGLNYYDFKTEEITSSILFIEKSFFYQFKYKQVSFNYGLIYKFSNKETSPYLKTGFSSIYSFNYEAQKVYTDSESTEQILEPRNYQWGYNIGAGIDFSNFCIEYQIQWATGPSTITNLKLTPITNYITVSYAFSSKKK